MAGYCSGHCPAIVHVLDDLEGDIQAGGFGKGFREGMVPFLAVKNLENILVSTVCVSGG